MKCLVSLYLKQVQKIVWRNSRYFFSIYYLVVLFSCCVVQTVTKLASGKGNVTKI